LSACVSGGSLSPNIFAPISFAKSNSPIYFSSLEFVLNSRVSVAGVWEDGMREGVNCKLRKMGEADHHYY
jgi:hypothetical protein